MAVIGYKRVSTEGQNLDRQDLGELDKVFEEKLSGKSAKDRPALQAMIEYARECGFHKIPDKHFTNSRTRVSVHPGQGFR